MKTGGYVRKTMMAMVLLGMCWTACITEDEAVPATGDSGSIGATEANVPANLTTVEWLDSIRNMGSIQEGQLLEVVFRFRNTGEKPLVIENVSAGCGCTIPEKPTEPIMPGKEGRIKAQFNSEGRPGANHKTVTVQANTVGNHTHVLEFNVEVKAKEQSKPANPAGNSGA